MRKASVTKNGEFMIPESKEVTFKKIDDLIDNHILKSYKSYKTSLYELKSKNQYLKEIDNIKDKGLRSIIVQMSIITLVKCFNKNEQRNQLDQNIFKDIPYLYNHIERVRNQYIAHDSSDYSSCEVFIGINEKTHKHGIVAIPYESFLDNDKYIESLLVLYKLAISHAMDKIKHIEEIINSQLSDIEYEQVLQLEDVVFAGPNAGKLDKKYYYDEIKKYYEKKIKTQKSYEKKTEDQYIKYINEKKEYILININDIALNYEENISIQEHIQTFELELMKSANKK